MLTYWMLALTAALSDHSEDIRPLLRAQGFEWTLEKSDSHIIYVGDIGGATQTYSIYLYNAVNRESGHGLNLFIYILNKTTFLGVHEAGSAHECRIQKNAVVCKSDYPGRRIQFTKNGPPLMLWFDGYYESLWFAPKFEQEKKSDPDSEAINYFHEDYLKYFPLSKYEIYPEAVKLLIRQADIENDQCRGRFDEHTLHACNRRDVIMDELEKRGWCYGDSLVGYGMHWLKCADDPHYLPSSPGSNKPYSEENSPTSIGATEPRKVFAQHDPHGRLLDTTIQQLGIVRVGTATYSIYYLDFSNPISLHGLQQIAIIRNRTEFAGAYKCTLGPDEGELVIGKDRLTVRISGMTFVIRFDEEGPTRNKYFCGEGSGWTDEI